jgi:hypothetical protein
MSPPPWTSPEQLDFLNGKRAAFADAQKNKTLPQFFTSIHGEFFTLWPNPDSEIVQLQPDAEVTEKKKRRKRKSESSTPVPVPCYDEWFADRKGVSMML